MPYVLNLQFMIEIIVNLIDEEEMFRTFSQELKLLSDIMCV